MKTIYKNRAAVYDARVQKLKHNNNTNPEKYGELANKLFSWALVRQVATYRFHACVYRRSFYRIFNALVWNIIMFSMICDVKISLLCGVLVKTPVLCVCVRNMLM